ncbi:MAG: FISUMP domain-containing protein [Bacteroidales bacterium]|nr:FISUMP domain-containing protein [Bacteroidales bacterium]
MKKSILLFAGLALLTLEIQAQTVIDYDGNVYDTVTIGTQVWLKQNLKVTHYNNGNPIPNVTDIATWANLTTGARCYYNNDSTAYDSVYGALYNWYVAQDPNICPAGWHVSSNAEWQTTETFLGGASIAGGKMKEAGTIHWASPNFGASNSSEFTGLPGGMRDPSGVFSSYRENGFWWTTTAYNASSAWSTYLWFQFAGVDHNPTPKKYGLSIRCIKDNSVGFGENNSLEKIKLYPNPANDQITIDYNDGQNLSLSVYNIVGKLVLQRELNKNKNIIDISTFATGVYIIRINGASLTVQQKLIIE